MAQLAQRALAPEDKATAAPQTSLPVWESGAGSWIPFVLLALIALALRLWDLGSRAMHHDESLHALYGWYLYAGRGYVHDPMMHGPLQFHATALSYLLFGDSEATARLPYALLGTGMVLLPYFLRHELGRIGAITASALLAFSPAFVYFSRFTREDAVAAFDTLLVVVGTFGWMRTRRSVWLYVSAAALALLFSTKEVSFIAGFIFASFFLLVAAVERLRGGTGPVLAALGEVGWRRWGIAAAIFFGISIVLYTTFFTNLEGLCTALWAPPVGTCAGKQAALQYWLAQHGVSRGAQPWFYYLLVLSLYEVLTLALAGAALFLARPRGLFFWFCLWWAGLSLLIYSWAGEKMPWLSLHLLLPLVLLGALAVDRAASWLSRPWGLAAGQWPLVGLLLLGLGAFAALATVYEPTSTALAAQTLTLRRIALIGVLGGLVAAAVWMGAGLRSRQVLGAAGVAGATLLVAYTVRTTWQLNFKNGDTPVEMLVYVQSAPDVPFVVKELERLGSQLGLRKETPVLLDGGYTETIAGQNVVHEAISWPFEWYLRDHRGKQYYSRHLPADFSSGRYAAVLVMAPNLDPIRDQLTGYTGHKFRLNWWYPEDYKQLTWGTVFQTPVDPAAREKLLRYLLYRDLINPPLGAREFYFYARNDLVAGSVIPSERPPAPLPEPPPLAVAEVPVREVQIYGRPGGLAVLRDPKGIALGPEGRLYVVDGVNSTVTVFNRDGSVARRWGRKGTGDGEFNEPWGIAVGPDGSVFVADTWNHRIQKFDLEGRLLAKWGVFADTQGQAGTAPGGFFGPRDLAFTPAGDLLVTDTGNERIQVFDLDGRYLRSYGGEGRGVGQFREPVGLAVDAQGRIYVADMWNQRIQVFGPAFDPVAQYPVPLWKSQSAQHKPYLAVGPGGDIFVTVPEGPSVVRVRQGVVSTLSLRGGSRLGLPIGVEVDVLGRLLVSDAQAGVVVAQELADEQEDAPSDILPGD